MRKLILNCSIQAIAAANVLAAQFDPDDGSGTFGGGAGWNASGKLADDVEFYIVETDVSESLYQQIKALENAGELPDGLSIADSWELATKGLKLAVEIEEA